MENLVSLEKVIKKATRKQIKILNSRNKKLNHHQTLGPLKRRISRWISQN